jgi:hypothetical protein
MYSTATDLNATFGVVETRLSAGFEICETCVCLKIIIPRKENHPRKIVRPWGRNLSIQAERQLEI